MKYQLQGRRSRVRKIAKHVVLLALPTAVGLLVGACLLRWHPCAEVSLQLTVREISFKVDQDTQGPLLRHIAIPTFSVSGFKSVQLTPQDGAFKMADATKFDLKARHYPDSAWIKLNARRIGIVPESPDLGSQVMVTADQASGIKLESLPAVAASRVVIEIPGDPPTTQLPNGAVNVVIGVTRSAEPEFTLPVRVTGPIAVTPTLCNVTGSPLRNQPATYLVTLADADPDLTVRANELIMSFQLPDGWSGIFLDQGHVRTNEVRFDREIQDVHRTASTLVYGDEPNSLVYPSYRDKDVQLIPPQSVVLDPNDVFTLKAMGLNKGHTGIRLTLAGRAKKIISRIGSTSTDLQIDGLDRLKQRNWPTKLVAFAIWSVPTTLAVLKFVKEFKAEVES